MGAAIALVLIVLLFAVMIFGLRAEQRKRAALTEEEWENRERQTSVLSASVMALEHTFRPHLKDIAAVQMDAAEGRRPGAHQENNQKSEDQTEQR